MKRVGILTFHRASNYGAALQAYALRTTISSLGYDCEIVDYGSVGQVKTIRFNFSGVRQFLSSIIVFSLNFINVEIRYYKFKQFRINYIKTSRKRYINCREIKLANSYYDIFCTGSDQVWNLKLSKNDFTYLLDFVKKPRMKFSYAASFGDSKIDIRYQETYSKLLNEFDMISVRELSGQNLIKKLNGRDSKITIDPTFLVSRDHWAKLAKGGKRKKPYILCYVIMSDPPGLTDFCKKLKKTTGFDLVRIQNPVLKPDFNFATNKTTGPLEFLSLVKDASIMVTNSFHGTSFSIIFEVPFFTFLFNNERDLRLIEITNKLKLNDRLIRDASRVPEFDDINIDYRVVNEELKVQINDSLCFLKEALNCS